LKFFRSARLSDLFRRIADDRGAPASFAIGVDNGGSTQCDSRPAIRWRSRYRSPAGGLVLGLRTWPARPQANSRFPTWLKAAKPICWSQATTFCSRWQGKRHFSSKRLKTIAAEFPVLSSFNRPALTLCGALEEDTRVPETVQCNTHGETEQTFVCTHLVEETSGLGFNRDEPDEENPFPDAWCDNCELIHAAHGDWSDEAQELTKIVLLCSGCYERARIRNTRPSITLDDLAGLRWKCGSCEEWHTGPCLDFGVSKPVYWKKEYKKATRWMMLSTGVFDKTSKSFLDEDYCVIDDEHFFVRGNIHLPIIGAAETFRWGVWGSLSRESFEALLKADGDPKRAELPRMFSWLSSRISEYPDTLNLKMHVHIQAPGSRPHFRLEPTDHPLAQEYHHGITPERVREIMLSRLPAAE
jgi:hypothetical protein